MSSNPAKTESRVAIFIALLAIFVSFYESFENRNHNRLSIKPYINASMFSKNNSYEVSIKNAGLGPAIVENFQVYANDKEVRNWNRALDEINLNKYSWMSMLAKGDILSSGDEMILIRLDTVQPERFNLKFKLTYKSAYEEIFTVEKSF